MRLLFALALFSIAAGVGSSWASSGGDAIQAADQGLAESESPRTPGMPGAPTVDMRALVAPVIVNGELQRYVYLSVKLKLYDVNQKAMMLKKIPYLQDAFLRDVHGPSIAFNNDPSIVDEAGLRARLMRICDRIAGAGIVKTIEFWHAGEAPKEAPKEAPPR